MYNPRSLFSRFRHWYRNAIHRYNLRREVKKLTKERAKADANAAAANDR